MQCPSATRVRYDLFKMSKALSAPTVDRDKFFIVVENDLDDYLVSSQFRMDYNENIPDRVWDNLNCVILKHAMVLRHAQAELVNHKHELAKDKTWYLNERRR